MIKNNLPVILLKGVVLLPHNELRLEFDNDEGKNIIDVSELFHENKILIINKIDPLEEVLNIDNMPKIGVIAKIKHKMDLPNGNLRVILKGEKRALVHEYLNLNHKDEILESIISDVKKIELDQENEQVLIRKVIRETENYVKRIPYISNSILSLIASITSLDKLTDVIAPNLPITNDRLIEYLNEINPNKKATMILSDIYKEEEMFTIEKQIDAKVREELDNSQREYIIREKIKMLKEELGDYSSKDNEIDDLYLKVEQKELPITIKNKVVEEIKKYASLPTTSPEVNIARNYIDCILDLPWVEKTLDNDNLKIVRKNLDNSHFGLDDVKLRIIEYLAVKKMTNSLKSPILCLVGPPGVGKTSLAFSISKSINRNFVKVSVGGVNDEAEIKGHRKTYIGAQPGRIISSMKKAKSINPVFLIDEIDKMSKNIKGDPASALLEVLDPEQNRYFSDNYLEENYDLSQVMFIATANYIEDIPEALQDRLEVIKLSGYTEYEKLDIVKKHLIPKICENHGIKAELLNFDEQAILDIIRYYTKEAGVRELERQIAKIVRKVVTAIVINNVHLASLNILSSNLEKYLGKKKYQYLTNVSNYQVGVVNGLAYTQYGGDTLSIEVNYYEGNGELKLTGNLGEVMKESALLAFSYIKANCKKLNIDYKKLTDNDIHIHVPEGAIPKDGPSAGIALTTALISALSNLKIEDNLAMTGEITLRGQVLAIGGLKEKSLGAYRKGIRRIIIPSDNLKDLDEIPEEVKKAIEYIPVKDYNEVYEVIKKTNKKEVLTK